MNKTELVAALAGKAELSKKDAEKALNAFVEVVSDAMKAGDKIVVTYTDAAHGIEFKIPEVWDHMAGSREAAWINGAAAYEQFITEKALE